MTNATTTTTSTSTMNSTADKLIVKRTFVISREFYKCYNEIMADVANLKKQGKPIDWEKYNGKGGVHKDTTISCHSTWVDDNHMVGLSILVRNDEIVSALNLFRFGLKINDCTFISYCFNHTDRRKVEGEYIIDDGDRRFVVEIVLGEETRPWIPLWRATSYFNL